ncbi:MAG: sel1 repeat family protein, partial [Akkermansiaceae bacterium]|nr:sel1 repeat family protein [Verrucomicrobiales bacterium]
RFFRRDFHPYAPWVPEWRAADAARVRQQWLSFLKTLCTSADPRRRLYGHMMRLDPWTNPELSEKKPATFEPGPASVLPGFFQALWTMREDLAARKAHWLLFNEALWTIDRLGENLRGFEQERDKLRRDLFAFFVSKGAAVPADYARLSFRKEAYADSRELEAAMQLLRTALNAASPKHSDAFSFALKRLETVEPKSTTMQEAASAPGSADPFQVSRFQPVDGEVETILWADDRLWVLSYGEVGCFTLPNVQLIGTVPTPKRELRTQRTGDKIFAVASNYLFLEERGVLKKYDAGQKTWVNFSAPMGAYAQLWSLRNQLYAGSEEGVVLRIDPKSGAAETLASSRRKPAQTILDDQPPFKVRQIFADASGAPCVLTGKHAIYSYDETKRQWLERYLPERLFARPVFDRSLLLRAIGSGAMIEQAAFDMVLSSLWLDTLKQGKLSAMPRNWPIKFAISAKGFGDLVYDAASDGTDLWLLFWSGDHGRMCLKRMSGTGTPDALIPLTFERIFGEPKLLLTPHGFAIHSRDSHGFYFLPRLEIEKFIRGEKMSVTGTSTAVSAPTQTAAVTNPQSSTKGVDEFQAAVRHYELKDIPDSEVVQIFERLKQQGDVRATMWLARFYHKGRCSLPQRPDLADKMAREVIGNVLNLAEKGDADAQFLVGAAYFEALGVDRNLETAAQWLSKAADAGQVTAFNHFGVMLAMGYGTAPDGQKGAKVVLSRCGTRLQHGRKESFRI